MFCDLVVSEWAPYGSLSADQLLKLQHHFELLVRWNKVLNLTRISKLEDVVRLHYCESLFLGSLLPAGAQEVVDIGSGAGFPGVPVAILRPECSVTLVESHHRKAVFLSEACAALENVRVIQGRAEEVEGQFDWLISRAVALEDVLSLHLSDHLAILMSENDLTRISPNAGLVRVPWGERRVVSLFHVEHEGAKI